MKAQFPLVPKEIQKGVQRVGEYKGEMLSCCGEMKGVEWVHDFECEPGMVFECLWCAFCGCDFETYNITGDYLEYEKQKSEDNAESRLTGN